VHPSNLAFPSSTDSQVTFVWILGYIDMLEYNAIDLAAKQVPTSTKIADNSFLPAIDNDNYFRSLILQS